VTLTSDYFQEQYPAPKPRSETLSNYVLELRGMNEMPTWQGALKEYLHTYYPELFNAAALT